MATNLQAINRLLNETWTLQDYESKLTEATGEHFNVFEILRIGSLEVTTHSPMLAELLNPKGRHGMGFRFLEIFAEQLSLKLEVDAATHVKQEHRGESGGRIDIFITDKNNNEVGIENKIYATDQEQQINRYLKDHPRAKVLYLTLDGDEPTDGIPSKDPARFVCISYKSDIIKWLDACRKEAARSPLVRETIVQYINLIKVLTGQNTNSRMNVQIAKSILRDKESLEAYLTLLGSKEHVVNELLNKLGRQFKEIADELDLHVHFEPNEFREKHGGAWFSDEEMERRNVSICFQFDQNNFRNLCFGFARLKEEKRAARTPITDRFENIFGTCNSGSRWLSWWLAWKLWPGRGDWWSDGTFEDIREGKFKKDLRELVEKLAKIIRQTNGSLEKTPRPVKIGA